MKISIKYLECEDVKPQPNGLYSVVCWIPGDPESTIVDFEMNNFQRVQAISRKKLRFDDVTSSALCKALIKQKSLRWFWIF